MQRGVKAAIATAALAIGLTTAGPAGAAERIVTYKGFDAPDTPARYDKVKVVETGPSKAKHILVLVPGTSGGAGYFAPDARDLAKQLPGWQIWSIERRENLLEDHSVLDQALTGKATMKQLFDYYLGWIANPNATSPHYTPPTDAETAPAREWGMEVAVEDLHVVIKRARKGGREVVLGGHSLGGSITTAYAAWDFDGRAGAKDLAGLVYIDGGSGGAPVTPAAAKKSLADLSKSSPFLDLTGTSLPWTTGVFASVGSTLALQDPDAPSILQSWSFFPAALKPAVPVTNKAGFGYVLDNKSGPSSLALVQAHIGALAPSGDVRGWVDDGITPVNRAAQAMNGIVGSDGTTWFHPRRLSIDAGAVAGGVANPAQKTLDVKATHGRAIHLPIYAFETSLGKGRVLKAAKALARRGHVKAKDVTLVDRSSTYSHCDPIFAAAATNDFLKTVVPFLKKLD
jgi:pimeloyl-ACP methyl ester carboxylesterase